MAKQNIGTLERIGSIAAGSALITSGIMNIFDKPAGSLLKFAGAGLLIWRAASGYCPLKNALSHDDESVSTIEKDYYPEYASEDDYPVAMEQAY